MYKKGTEDIPIFYKYGCVECFIPVTLGIAVDVLIGREFYTDSILLSLILIIFKSYLGVDSSFVLRCSPGITIVFSIIVSFFYYPPATSTFVFAAICYFPFFLVSTSKTFTRVFNVGELSTLLIANATLMAEHLFFKTPNLEALIYLMPVSQPS